LEGKNSKLENGEALSRDWVHVEVQIERAVKETLSRSKSKVRICTAQGKGRGE